MISTGCLSISCLLEDVDHELLNGAGVETLVCYGVCQWKVTVVSPFCEAVGPVPKGVSPKAWSESTLAWYFEEYYQFPLEPARKTQAEDVLREYGLRLFSMVVPRSQGMGDQYNWKELKAVEVRGPPAFQSLHWEAMVDGGVDIGRDPLAVRVPMSRLRYNPDPDALRVLHAKYLNILVVTPRPSGPKDIKLRTISLPLVQFARENPDLRLRVHVLRPATFESLCKHLEDVGAGHYHVLHYDGHGDLLTKEEITDIMEGKSILRKLKGGEKGYGQKRDLVNEEFEGARPCLLFESGDGKNLPNPVDGWDVGRQVANFQIPIVILDACRTGRHTREGASLAGLVVDAGASAVIGNAFSVLVDGAKVFVENLYGQLLIRQKTVNQAVQEARRRMQNGPDRQARLNEKIKLKDWVLPRLFFQRSSEMKLVPDEMTAEELTGFYASLSKSAKYRPPNVRYRFVGRDREVQMIEERLLREVKGANVLLLHGAGGIGKTTFLKHLASWWHAGGFILGVIEMDFEQEELSVDQIVTKVGQVVFNGKPELGAFNGLESEGRWNMVMPVLQKNPYLILLDHLESVGDTSRETEGPKLRSFLEGLALQEGTKVLGQDAVRPTLTLLASRDGASWLFGDSPFAQNSMELQGVDVAAQEELALLVLGYENKHYLREKKGNDERETVLKLLKHLNGHPLGIEVVLALVRSDVPPSLVLQAFESQSLRKMLPEDVDSRVLEILKDN